MSNKSQAHDIANDRKSSEGDLLRIDHYRVPLAIPLLEGAIPAHEIIRWPGDASCGERRTSTGTISLSHLKKYKTLKLKVHAGSEERVVQQVPARALNFLLVDDDDICLFIHRRVLELTGYCKSIHSASNGKTALEILGRASAGAMALPDIILLDLDMPIMNGLRFLEKLREVESLRGARIAIVLLTSSVLEKDRTYAMSLGVSHCLSKPLTQDNLNAVVQSLYRSEPPTYMSACK